MARKAFYPRRFFGLSRIEAHIEPLVPCQGQCINCNVNSARSLLSLLIPTYLLLQKQLSVFSPDIMPVPLFSAVERGGCLLGGCFLRKKNYLKELAW